MKQFLCLGVGMCMGVGIGTSKASATVFASSVVANQSSGFVSPWTNPQAALGAPSLLNGVGTDFQSVLSPFNPNYEAKDLVEIAPGGQLTLQFPNFVTVGGGNEVGVISSIFMVDSNYPSGLNSTPAQASSSRSAEVLVSDNGTTWHSIGTHVFDHPANGFTDAASPYQATAGTSPADFGIPFTHSTSDFDGKTWAQTLALFGNSGGGSWLDLSSSGLTQIDYIQFRTTSDALAIDAVSINNADVGAAVPEPASLAGVLLAGTMLVRRRR